jgi:transposase
MNREHNEEEIKFIEEYKKLCDCFSDGCPYSTLLTTFEANRQSLNYIEFVNGVYIYGGYERGRRGERCSSPNMAEVMYYAVEFATWKLAGEWERRNRIPNQDARILRFRKEVEYMGKVNPLWAEKLHADLSQYLEF